MPASIRTTLLDHPGGTPVGPTTTGASRNDLRKGYQVVCESVYEASTYHWTLAFTPDSVGPTALSSDDYAGTPSEASLLPPEGSTARTCRFNVDWDGSYLLRLVVDMGLLTEATMFLRFRSMTRFANLKLVAAGERRDANGTVPTDASPEGWADDQNANLQRLLSLVRRTAVSGRVLYVDANRGRDNAADPNDPDNIIRMPGPDPAARDETGIRIAAEGFADFSSINDAVDYALAADLRGEPPVSAADPYRIVVAPGNYTETLVLHPHVDIYSSVPPTPSRIILGAYVPACPVTVTAVTGSHTLIGSGFECCTTLQGICLEGQEDTDTPTLRVEGASLSLDHVSVQKRTVSGQAVYVGDLTAVLMRHSYIQGPQPVSIPMGETPCGVLLAGTSYLIGENSHISGCYGIAKVSGGASPVVWGFGTILSTHADAWAVLGFPQQFLASHSRIGWDLNVTPGTGGSIGFGVGVPAGFSTQGALISLRHVTLDGVCRIVGAATSNSIALQTGSVVLPTEESLEIIGTNVSHEILFVLGRPTPPNRWETVSVTQADSPYAVSEGVTLCHCDPTMGPITVELPETPENGRNIRIKDATGQAGANSIILQARGTDLFSAELGGLATYTVSVAYTAISLYYQDGVWNAV